VARLLDAWPEVSFVALIEAPPATLVAARHRDCTHPLVPELVELAVEIAAYPDLDGGHRDA
jgi:hypothetical protein